MSADIFALAREAVTRSLIESMFGCEIRGGRAMSTRPSPRFALTDTLDLSP